MTLNLIALLRQFHFFHDWTKWERKQVECTMVGGLLVPKDQIGKQFTEVWQERKCQLCGWIEQERLRT